MTCFIPKLTRSSPPPLLYVPQAVASDHPAQFITSTFRPEMVQAADKCYGVSHLHKISRIRALGAEEALEFIRDTLEAEEAVAGAAGEGEEGGGSGRSQ